MSKYIVPVCFVSKSKIYNEEIVARSFTDCQDKLMEKFSDYSNEVSYHDFVNDLRDQDILIGKITDVEEL
jgi:hypothetical protein|nr:MAG TPA: hypothetical protein [Caudoviricetes sp.]